MLHGLELNEPNHLDLELLTKKMNQVFTPLQSNMPVKQIK